jgi:hypothetical protein
LHGGDGGDMRSGLAVGGRERGDIVGGMEWGVFFGG